MVDTMEMNGEDDDIKNRFSWSGFYSKKSVIRPIKTTSTLLPVSTVLVV